MILAQFSFNSLKYEPLLQTLLPILEILRLTIWNYFRLENQHRQKYGTFQRVHEIELPYSIEDTEDDGFQHVVSNLIMEQELVTKEILLDLLMHAEGDDLDAQVLRYKARLKKKSDNLQSDKSKMETSSSFSFINSGFFLPLFCLIISLLLKTFGFLGVCFFVNFRDEENLLELRGKQVVFESKGVSRIDGHL